MTRTSQRLPTTFPMRLNGAGVALLAAIATDSPMLRSSEARRHWAARLNQLRLPALARVQLRARDGAEPLLARVDIAFDQNARRIVAFVAHSGTRKLLRAVVSDPRRLRFASLPTPTRLRRPALPWRLRRVDLPAIDRDAIEARGFAPQSEPRMLELVGFDRTHRPMLLAPSAARAWRAMRASAAEAGITLEPLSTFRSVAYQRGLIARKLKRGGTLDAILRVNAAPGYSEHHSGRAIDIGTPGCAALDETFEQTSAFSWLQQHAATFGFRISYPRDNSLGVIYEPWHWYYVGSCPEMH